MDLSTLSFSSPLVLLALALLPILWFLLRAMPSAPKRFTFPGYFFLKQIQNREETPSRTPWYILLIRTLILGAIILALAGPFLNNPERNDRTGPVLIVLDDGWPAANDWRLRQNTLRTISAELDESDRQVWLLTTSPQKPGQELQALRGPLTPDQLLQMADTVEPVALAPDRFEALKSVAQISTELGSEADIRWLSDGLFTGPDLDERQFMRRLSTYGRVTAYAPERLHPVLSNVDYRADRLEAEIRLATPATADQNGTLSILARDGRLLEQTDYLLEAGKSDTSVAIDLPLTLRNDIGQIRLDGIRSAGAVQLSDASTRRALVGLASNAERLSGTLLDSGFYLQQALSPYALFRTDTASALATSDATVIILDDIGRLRQSDAEALRTWIDKGGVLIRFAGPVLADASQDPTLRKETALLPVDLRGGGRAFGGALTWEEPQKLGGFADVSPFADLDIDPTVEIRRQVLARPGADTSERSWAYLQDGTPLVTATAQGKGLIVLFHVTAAPDWSDLPISGLFVEMLRRVTALSVTETARSDPEQTFVPRRQLNGFGQLENAPDDARPVKARAAAGPASAIIPAGLYGDPSAPLAVNAVTPKTNIYSLDSIGLYDATFTRGYDEQEVRFLAVWFLLMALLLLLLDTVLTLHLNGKLIPAGRPVSSVALLLIISIVTIIPTPDALAQVRPPLDPKAAEAALYTRFAYVITGDLETDEISRAGLFGLSTRLNERSALEPAAPTGVNPAVDDLSVYPLIYWPILPSAPVPAENTLVKIEAYMAGGGLIIFDTRDGVQSIGNQQTEEQAALKRILEQLNVPPLEPVPPGHVLRRSFYLLDDLPGRNAEGPVWVEARSATGNINDGVTPIIIGGRDWASAWAMDERQRPLRPMGRGASMAREQAFRSGINMAMVALTGNYKVDQLQAEALLEMLGRERFQP